MKNFIDEVYGDLDGYVSQHGEGITDCIEQRAVYQVLKAEHYVEAWKEKYPDVYEENFANKNLETQKVYESLSRSKKFIQYTLDDF